MTLVGFTSSWDGIRMPSDPQDPKVIGRFAFGITVYRYPDGRIEYRSQSRNQGVPIEIVLMQLKAFIRNQENEYFDNYDSSISKTDFKGDG